MSELYSAEQLDSTTVKLSSGQVVKGFHKANLCKGPICPVHKPTNHKLRDLPLSFNGRHMVRHDGEQVMVDPDDFDYNKSGEAILKNAAKCLTCGITIESKYRHDFVTCKCGEVSVDGGVDYVRRLFKNKDTVEDLSIVVRKPDTTTN